jgi:hypothetical protein
VQASRELLAFKALLELQVSAERQGLQALGLLEQLAWPALLALLVLRAQMGLQVRPALPAFLEPQAPRDHRDSLQVFLTTQQKQQQQVAIQAMDLFCGIMPHKLMRQNYWLAT